MSVKNPIPSNVIYNIERSYISSEDNKKMATLKPFLFLIDDKVLEVPGYHQKIFSGFNFILEDTILLLKTMDNRYVVIYKTQAEKRPYELFSTQGEYLFDEIVDINCGGYGLTKVFAFCVKKYNNHYHYLYQKYSKKIFLHKIGWSCTSDGLNGLDPKEVVIEQPKRKRSKKFEISELFGPLPQWSKEYDYRYSKNPWWVALCSDDKYRIMNNSHDNLSWITTKDGNRIETFKRFIPLMKPNYFYFLTTKNEELLLRAYENYGALEDSLEEARKGIYHNRINFYYNKNGLGIRDGLIFPGIKYETWLGKDDEKITPGVFNQQKNLGW